MVLLLLAQAGTVMRPSDCGQVVSWDHWRQGLRTRRLLRLAFLPEACCPERFVPTVEAGCSQEEGPKKGFVMGSRTQGVQEILEKCM